MGNGYTDKQWRALIRGLRKTFPLTNVCVRRVPVVNAAYSGRTRFDGTRYHIRVNSNQPWSLQVDCLLHEWAHAAAIEEAFGHDGAWKMHYGKIYQAWADGIVDGVPK